MKITRKLETATATYDLTGLTRKEFSNLLHSYEKQMYIWHNRCPEEGADELLDKMKQMAESDTLII